MVLIIAILVVSLLFLQKTHRECWVGGRCRAGFSWPSFPAGSTEVDPQRENLNQPEVALSLCSIPGPMAPGHRFHEGGMHHTHPEDIFETRGLARATPILPFPPKKQAPGHPGLKPKAPAPGATPQGPPPTSV